MALFRRNKQDLTPEFQEYYQTPGRRSGTAWLMAVATIAIGAALILGLFYGGRWTYRKLANRDDKKTTATPANTDLIGGNAQVLKNPSDGSKTPTPPTPNPSNPSPTPAKTPTPPPARATAPSPAPASLPATGPDIDL